MANIKSQIKDIRQNENRRRRNAARKSQMKTLIKKTGESSGDGEDKDGEGAENLRLAVQAIDKAVKQGVLHKNTGARKKSLLQKSFNQKN